MCVINEKSQKLEKENKRPLILVTNDDGYYAGGFKALIEIAKTFGDVVAVAPEVGNSGMSHAITIKVPIRLRLLDKTEGLALYACSGTPADCIKLAINQVLDRKPDLVLSGVNHGSNSSISLIYSGTMAGAIEGCLNGIDSVGLSLLDFARDANFQASVVYGKRIVSEVLRNGLPKGTCLNVNIPEGNVDEIKGVKVCRQNKGRWVEEFEKRTDPRGSNYFWLTGYYCNDEPESTDTDEAALNNKYVSIVPVKVDLSDYVMINTLNGWDLNENN